MDVDLVDSCSYCRNGIVVGKKIRDVEAETPKGNGSGVITDCMCCAGMGCSSRCEALWNGNCINPIDAIKGLSNGPNSELDLPDVIELMKNFYGRKR